MWRSPSCCWKKWRSAITRQNNPHLSVLILTIHSRKRIRLHPEWQTDHVTFVHTDRITLNMTLSTLWELGVQWSYAMDRFILMRGSLNSQRQPIIKIALKAEFEQHVWTSNSCPSDSWYSVATLLLNYKMTVQYSWLRNLTIGCPLLDIPCRCCWSETLKIRAGTLRWSGAFG